MSENEKRRFVHVIESINDGKLIGLPKYIIDSNTEGLNILIQKLVRTGFLYMENEN